MTGLRPTARLVIIGNEILSGKVADANGPFLLRRLRRIGVRCTRLEVIPDDIAQIAAAVRDAAARADHVFTSGGVGPTHDDLTMAGVAAAFDVPLVEDPFLVDLITNRWPGPASAARLRMARVPQGSEVVEGHRFPQVRIRNVWIFPGVPQLLRSKFQAIEARFAGVRPACAALRCTMREGELAEHLEVVDAGFEDVELGSYPRWNADDYEVLVTLEGPDRDRVLAALEVLAARVGSALRDVEREYRPEDEED